MSVGDVSDIFPDDSISQRDAKIAAQQRKYHRPPSEASEAPSVISFHSSGLDLVPPATLSEDDVPPNCRFEVDDANLTFEHYEGCFNLIHVRSTEAGINDFEGFLYEIAKIMKPWGVLILVTGYPQIYDIDAKPFPVVEEGEPGFSWLQHNFYQCYKAYQNRNNSAVDASLYWHDYLESNPNFTSPKTQDTFIPLGPFKPNMSEYEKKVSNLMREDIMHIMSAFKPLLVGDGHKEEDVDRWIANSVQELQELRICGHIKWRYTVAIRKNLPWQERMEQPEPVEPRTGSLVVRKSPRGSVVSGCSTNITARTHSTGTVYPPTVTTWAMGVPPGPPELHFRSN
ncbi:hypothetical protein FRB90_006457 [Tulasnella sp. 427]|nr:hypothetical protein FRB90_006457 [Tulasnella sp. 427]